MKKSSSGHSAVNPESFVPVAITGIGCLFPKSSGAKEYWRTLFRGIDCITEVPESHWSPSDYYDADPSKPDHVYCKRGGFLDHLAYDPSEFGIPPSVLEATDSSQLLGLVAAKMALNDAGYGEDGKHFNKARTSVILGATGTQELTIPLATRLGHPVWRRALNDSGLPAEKTEEVIKRISAGFVSWQESSFPGLLGNVIAGRIANRLDLGGTNCVVDAACGSSLGAAHLAILELISGRSDMAITGGVDLLNDIFMHICFAKTGVLSKSGDAKPFSEDADGTVLGEGIGMVTLKRLEDAEHDGDRIYAVIKGAGSSSDGRSQSIYAPSAKGQEKALKKAYESAGFSPVTVDLLEAHGTGTIVGDEVEFSALRHVFGKREGRNQIALGSVKSMIGHTKAAAGAAGMIKTALALHNKVIPPTLKVSKPDPKLGIEDSPIFLPYVSLPWFSNSNNPRRAGVSAFGFGGSNFHIVMEEYKKNKNEPSWDGSAEIFAFSADSRDEVAKELEKARSAIATDSKMTSMTAYESRNNFDSRKNCRLLVSSVFDSVADILEKSNAMLDAGEKEFSSRSGSAYYSEGALKGKTAFIFPGQGSQYTGMARELSCIFPEMMESIEKASCVFKGDKKLHELMFPRSGEEEENETELRNTSVAQPAIGAITLGMIRILGRFGIKPDSVCGHSFGELSALACAGSISEDDFLRLAALRGKYMAEAGKGGDAGTMLAVKAKLSDIENMIKETGVDVVLANRNSHDQGVLSGSAEAIEQAKQFCKERKMRGTQLNVAAAFHSRFVASAAVPFSGELEKIEFRKNGIPVYANTTASPYPASIDESRHLLGNQLVNSVNFVGIIEAMHDSGIHTFIETGPKTVLTGLVKSILKGREFECLATDDSSGKKSGLLDLASLICKLGAMGHDVKLSDWETRPHSSRKPKMNIPINGTNYRNPQKILKIPVSAPVEFASTVLEKSNQPTEQKNIALKIVDTARTELKPPETVQQGIKPEIRVQQSRSTEVKNMDTRQINPPPKSHARSINATDAAVRSINEGFRAMQALQMQTTDAHKKFLDTQMQAGKTLETLMSKIGEISGMSSGVHTVKSSPAYEQAETRQPLAEQFYEPSGTAHKVDHEPATHASSSAAAVSQAKIQTMPVQEIKKTTKPEAIKDSPKADTEKMKSTLLAVVSELTGYPVEMLDLDMDIESDLGIDSIKRVEILSSFEEKMPGAGNIDPADLGKMKTLGQIIEYISKGSDSSKPADTAAPVKTAGAGACSIEAVRSALIEVVSMLTGYPAEMLDPDMDIESDLGIDSIKRVEILSAFEEKMPGAGNVDPSDLGRLKTLGHIINYIVERNPASGSSEPAKGTVSPSGMISGAGEGKITEILLEVVSSLTGYPAEMLDLDMDIESDLGIDSIKRVEILSAFEEKMPGIPQIQPDELGRLKTLGQIVNQVINHLTGISSAGSSVKQTVTDARLYEKAVSGSTDEISRKVVTVFRDSSDSGEKLEISGTIYITGQISGLGENVANELKSRGFDVKTVDIDEASESIDNASGLVIISDNSDKVGIWQEEKISFLKKSFLAAKNASKSLCEKGKTSGAFFATVTRLDGAFGFLSSHVNDPVQGALAGLAKTARTEWPEVSCRAFDISPFTTDLKKTAAALADEILSKGAAETGFDDNSKYGLELSETAFKKPVNTFDKNDVIVITGGAKGVTAACAEELAAFCQPVMVLVGRSPEPENEPSWLSGIKDEPAMKKAILDNEFKGKKISPQELEKSFRKYKGAREIKETIEIIKSRGSKAAYFQADVRNHSDMESVIDRARSRFGSITGIIHGAGVLEDRFIADKTAEQFDNVFGTKIDGLKNLLDTTRNDPLKAIVFFSSVSARMGNKGQVDYSMANEVLNKMAVYEASKKPACRVVSINWGPWDGGMVSPALKKEFNRQGIELIPLKAGAAAMVSEMCSGTESSIEVVIGAEFRHEEKIVARKPEISTADSSGIRITAGINEYPVLNDHVIGGKAVVPVAIMAEWFGHAALVSNPGLHFHGLENMRVLNGIKLGSESQEFRILTSKSIKIDGLFKTDLEIRSQTGTGSERIHARATAVLGTSKNKAAAKNNIDPVISDDSTTITAQVMYDEILFHGQTLRGISEIKGLSDKGMTAAAVTAPLPSEWIKTPPRKKWIADPLLLDSAFQMASAWCYMNFGKVSLPSFTGQYIQYSEKIPEGSVEISMYTKNVSGSRMSADFVFKAENGDVISEIRGFESVMDLSLNNAFKNGGIKLKVTAPADLN